MFRVHTTDKGAVQPWEYLPAAAGTYQAGQMLTVSGGKLAAISAASAKTPEYLCQAEVIAEDGQVIPVTRVANDAIYETSLSAAAETAVMGTLLRLSAGGLEVDGGAAGTFEVVRLDGKEKGNAVYGRFR